MSIGPALGGGRTFVDATGAPVPLRGPVRRVVASDPSVGALLLEIGAAVVGCAGRLGDVPSVGEARRPDAARVAALRPDAVITGCREGRHDLAQPGTVDALRRIAPVIAVDVARSDGAVARADLRALLGSTGRTGVDPLGELDEEAAAHGLERLGPRAAALVREVARTGRPALLTDDGRAVAAIVDIADYRRLQELVDLVRELRLGK